MKTLLRYKFPLLILTIFIIATCKKDEEKTREYPRLNTLEVTNISDKGATFRADVFYAGNDEIIDHGFVWGTYKSLSFDSNDRTSLNNFEGLGQFEAEIKTTLEAKKEYFVMAFVKTANHTVYGTVVSFVSLGSGAPIIKGFEPKTAKSCDTVKIYGKYFSSVFNSNVVHFGDTPATVVQTSDTLLAVLVPNIRNETSVKVKVSICGNISLSSDCFSYLKPEITNIAPLIGTFNDTITVLGINLGCNSISFDGIQANIISSNSNQIKVTVPSSLTKKSNNIKINVSGYDFIYNSPFILNQHRIDGFSNDTLRRYNQVFTIYGDNFNPVSVYNKIEIDGQLAKVLESSRHFLKVILPNNAIPNYNLSVFKNINIKVTVLESTISKSIYLSWHSTWTMKKSFPGPIRSFPVAFTANNKGYYGTGDALNLGDGSLKDFWEYNPLVDEWTKINDFPGQARRKAIAFTIENYGYIGLGEDKENMLTDFYKFDPITKNWEQVANYPGVGRSYSTGFVVNNEAYVGTGYTLATPNTSTYSPLKDIWKYNPSNNAWSKFTDFPNFTYGAASFCFNNNGYICDKNQLFKMGGNNWTQIINTNIGQTFMLAFVINNSAFIGLGADNSFYWGSKYLWSFREPYLLVKLEKPLEFYYNGIYAAVSFVINGKAYIIGGINRYDCYKDVWEFDPTKPSL